MVWCGISQNQGFAALADALGRHVGRAAASIMRAPLAWPTAMNWPLLSARRDLGGHHGSAARFMLTVLSGIADYADTVVMRSPTSDAERAVA
jgi:hypothetical protein